ncbi:DsbA family protein [Pseudomonas lactucae]|uniref:DsbA family protein n=1 Tax=Pseudomonas lactucae TaxID=2813360 RepID=UPI003CC6035B
MQTPTKKYVVDIWSDFVCPWCWIAKRRFEKALEHSSPTRTVFKSMSELIV